MNYLQGFSSRRYWEERYKNGGNSGGGSYGRLAEFKAEIVNGFVKEKGIHSVVEWGCGDGNQLELMAYGEYLGLDVSETVVKICRERFSGDNSKSFECYDGESKCICPKRDMAVSLDVLYHLSEDKVYQCYMENLFSSSDKYVCIYSSDYENKQDKSYIRRRNFSKYVEEHYPRWELIAHIPNRYPAVKGIANPDTSNSEFYFYGLNKRLQMVREYGEGCFISREHMRSAYCMEDITDLPGLAYSHFMNHEEEVVYIERDDGGMVGVVSIGDLERFYEKRETELKINQKYTALDSVDYDAAAVFFRRAYPINEVPVITADNRLFGIIRYEKADRMRRLQRESLKEAKTGKDSWYKKEIFRFINQTKARVIIYNLYAMPYNKEETEIVRQRQYNTDKSKWNGLSDEEWKIFYQSEYKEGIADDMRRERNQSSLIIKNGVARFADRIGKFYSFKGGCRITYNNPPDADRRILMFGPCLIVGALCEDHQTIETYLQEYLNKSGYTSWKVLNKGMFGPERFHHSMFVEELSEDDIVIIWCKERWMPDNVMNKLVLKQNLADTYRKIPSLLDNIADSPMHCNFIVNKKIAEKMFQDLCGTGILDSPRLSKIPEKIQDYYIGWDIHEYFMDYFKQYGLSKESGDAKAGAIVMNCNPFTKGHRYLIEQALGMVDKLYVFVVEEDKSYFKFKDRFNMVKAGVSDLENVQVVPSGKYILSKDTFAQYFEKEQIQTVESMDYDIYIFGEVVAAGLGIKYRFVGEEPFDKVTRAYNETMKRILPDFGIEVIEFPRASSDELGGGYNKRDSGKESNTGR